MNPASSGGTKDVRTRRGDLTIPLQEVLTRPIEGLRHSTEGLGEAASIELPVEGVDPAIWTILEPWLHHHGATVGVRDHISDLHPRREREVQCDPFPGRLNECHSIGVSVMLVEIHGPILRIRALAGLRDHQRTGVHVPRANALDPSDGIGDRGFMVPCENRLEEFHPFSQGPEGVRALRLIPPDDRGLRWPDHLPDVAFLRAMGEEDRESLLELQHGAVLACAAWPDPSRTR